MYRFGICCLSDSGISEKLQKYHQKSDSMAFHSCKENENRTRNKKVTALCINFTFCPKNDITQSGM